MRRICLVSGLVGLIVLLAAPSLAHGELQGTSPEDGSTVQKPPKQITVTLTEAPTNGAEARATDGCKRGVSTDVAVDGNDIVLTTAQGQPGAWKVTYQAVSSVDGHQTKGTFEFTVSGKKDCSRDKDEKPEDEIDAADDPGIVENPNPPDEGGTSWLVWVGGGTALLVVAAFLVRRSTQ